MIYNLQYNIASLETSVSFFALKSSSTTRSPLRPGTINQKCCAIGKNEKQLEKNKVRSHLPNPSIRKIWPFQNHNTVEEGTARTRPVSDATSCEGEEGGRY